jgi:hypothetical protein
LADDDDRFPSLQPSDLVAKPFGETLLAAADEFGKQAALGLNIWKH